MRHPFELSFASRLVVLLCVAVIVFISLPEKVHCQSWEYFGPDRADWRTIENLDGLFKVGQPPILGVGTDAGVAIFDSAKWKYVLPNIQGSTFSDPRAWYSSIYFSPWGDSTAFASEAYSDPWFDGSSVFQIRNFHTMQFGNELDDDQEPGYFAFPPSDTNRAFVSGIGSLTSTDNGANWKGLKSSPAVPGLISTDGLLNHRLYNLGGTYVSGVAYKIEIDLSTDDGPSWSLLPAPLGLRQSAQLLARDSLLLLATDTGVFRSSNAGGSWALTLEGINVHGVAFNRLNSARAYAAGGTSIYASTDSGLTWNSYIDSLPAIVTSIVVDPYTDHLYLGTDSGVIRVTSGALGVPRRSNIPTVFTLEQNYPDPFNPSTTISFSLPHSQFATLEIFSLLGQKIATLVSQNLTAGKYLYRWNAGNEPSGVYFYKLRSGTFLDVKKMLLVK